MISLIDCFFDETCISKSNDCTTFLTPSSCTNANNGAGGFSSLFLFYFLYSFFLLIYFTFFLIYFYFFIY
jgi:hypothetical protein